MEDCSNGSYAGAPTDGGAWLRGTCSVRVLRGGAWDDNPRNLRAAYRVRNTTAFRNYDVGFRVARTLLDPLPPYLPRGIQGGWPSWRNLEDVTMTLKGGG